VKQPDIPAGFDVLQDSDWTLLVQQHKRPWLEPLLRNVECLGAVYPTQPLPGGRGGTVRVHAAGHETVVRPCRRGGLPARLLHDLYFGRRPRPFAELAAMETLRQRGVPVVEVYGAAVHWVGPCWYRGWLATRFVPDALTFWQWACAPGDAAGRARVLRAVGVAVRRLHDGGGTHPDLNANNVLIEPAARPDADPSVTFIDFDRARIAPDGQATPGSELDRLWRSLRKLDPHGQYITAAAFDTVRTAYAEAAACA